MKTNLREISPEDQARLVVLVNRYFTPFAILLVGMGVVLSQPQRWVMGVSVGLVFFSAVFNLGTARMAQRRGAVSSTMALVRLYTNLAVNVVLVYLLGGFWTPIWLLLVLGPVATALYGSRRRTLIISASVSVLLLLATLARGFASPLDLGQAVAQALFIVYLSLLVNELSGWVRQVEAGEEPDHT